MAYMSQEHKAKLAPAIKAICKKYKVNASLGVKHHSTLVLNIKSSAIDFIENFNSAIARRDPTGNKHIAVKDGHIQVNTFYTDSHYTGKAKDFFAEVIKAMNADNFDDSDSQTDYFHCGWHVNINVGQWNKPFEVV